MLIVTTDTIAGKKVVKTLGLARGASIRCRHVGIDILSFLRLLVGGEIKGYTKMLAHAREEAIERMCDVAREMGANAIVEMRFSSVEVMSTSAEVIAYGTAAVVKDQ